MCHLQLRDHRGAGYALWARFLVHKTGVGAAALLGVAENASALQRSRSMQGAAPHPGRTQDMVGVMVT